ncbi:MarR family transcriptional regulator [Parashewanella spongiae]|uniref:MarR family transcriptional regulator n=1 Tax=Parashewanella spongiae TaxID=342950 RepID=A0A3A6U419_9GAMM|nr:MarR family transcriptional regulator [Parashewanella spongiae]MCL1077837.1 MarR family transcriptional regulator [Parashewanella spongiae]RJY18866.1 MarR family transcriptional regulator [Parashewanella spongiae]
MKPDPEHKLSDNVCFAVYSANNAIIRAYRPLLEQYDLTFPQYLVMQALWCKDAISLTQLSQQTGLDLGSLTPIVKRLEVKELLIRTKDQHDERKKVIQLTEFGLGIRTEALELKQTLLEKVSLCEDELVQLRDQCLKVVKELDIK